MNIPEKACDYSFSVSDAKELLGAVLLPGDIRKLILKKYLKERGSEALVELFTQFIGMANSVIANNREVIEMELVTKDSMHPHTAEKINLPTLFGALNGVVIAAGVKQEKTCGGCAFRLGTPANQSPVTTCDADWCSHPDEVDFMCHEDLDDKGQPTKKCIGFAQERKKRKRLMETGAS
jgi:hypothetical protein